VDSRQSSLFKAIAAKMGHNSARVVSFLLPFQLGTTIVLLISSLMRAISESIMISREGSLPILSGSFIKSLSFYVKEDEP
jgi:hypothetical protein